MCQHQRDARADDAWRHDPGPHLTRQSERVGITLPRHNPRPPSRGVRVRDEALRPVLGDHHDR